MSGSSGIRYTDTGDATLSCQISIPDVMEDTSRHSAYIWFKSVIDRILALFGVLVTSPIMVLIAAIIKLDSSGDAIYHREQVGEKGCRFTAYKFRTMEANNNDAEYKDYLKKYVLENAPYKNDENHTPVYKVIDDPRVTKFGAWLRKTNLDELPQLFNVLKGEMSLIGPRPDIPYAVAMYKPWHLKRLAAKPGITGLWQVSGRKNLSFEGMVRLDIIYIKRQSLFLDFKILLATVKTILKLDGS